MKASSKGQPPYGFGWSGGELVVEPEQAEIRRRVFELFVLHRRKGAVARILNESRTPSPGRVKWSDTQISRLLECPSAVGSYAINKTTTDSEGHRVDRPQSEWTLVPCPAIVSQNLWDEAQVFLKQASSGRPAIYPFTGVLFCRCESAMYLSSSGANWACINCQNKIPDKELSSIVQTKITTYLQGTNSDLASAFETAWFTWPAKTRRAIVLSLVDRIIVSDNKLEIAYSAASFK